MRPHGIIERHGLILFPVSLISHGPKSVIKHPALHARQILMKSVV